MIFNTFWFACFAAAFFPLYWLLRWPSARAWSLLICCVVFHFHFAGPAGVLPIVVLGVITYFCALSRSRALCNAGIALSALALAFYKYTLFLGESALRLINVQWVQGFDQHALHWLPSAPPLAVSFFTFEFVHYLMEIRRGHEPIRNPREFTTFSIYFPSLVAGPIKRYRDFIPQLRAGCAQVRSDDVTIGLQRFALGAFKKLVLADNLQSIIRFVEPKFSTFSASDAWGFLIAISLRILFDFSGYSDMAIGLSRMMGIELPENFNYPYFAKNLQQFWQRWHISLSTWIRDYIYIPLGGNRHGLPRKIFNGVVAFALCGIWHGAAWHFLLWGLWHGAGLAVASTYRQAGPRALRVAAYMERNDFLAWLLTQLYVSVGWLLFFYPVDQAWRMAQKLFFIS